MRGLKLKLFPPLPSCSLRRPDSTYMTVLYIRVYLHKNVLYTVLSNMEAFLTIPGDGQEEPVLVPPNTW